MSSLDHCLKFALNIEDHHLFFQDYFKKIIHQKLVKVFVAEAIQPLCPDCGSRSLKHNGHYISYLRYPTADVSLPVVIKLKKQRVICQACGRTSMAQTRLVQKYCFISNASKRKVLAALTEDRSLTSIAQEQAMSVNSVQRILAGCSYHFHTDDDQLPAHLAFDEFRGVGRQLHFICLDSVTHQVVQILPTRLKKEIWHYFHHFTPRRSKQ